MTGSGPRPAAEITPVILGVVTIVSGVATGLFSDLRLLGKIVGLVALTLWLVALGSLLWRLGRESKLPVHVRIATFGGYIATAALLVIALQTGPRLSTRTLVLSARGQQLVSGVCPEADAQVHAQIALSQLDSAFVHIELSGEPCPGGDRDIRIRSDDLLAVLPE